MLKRKNSDPDGLEPPPKRLKIVLNSNGYLSRRFENPNEDEPTDVDTNRPQNRPSTKKKGEEFAEEWNYVSLIPDDAMDSEDEDEDEDRMEAREYDGETCSERRKVPCFGCSHVGENTPAIKGTELEKLLKNLGNGLRTSNLKQHCINISQQYEETIRQKANENLAPGEESLPPWKPSAIKKHLLYDHNDPLTSIELFMLIVKTFAVNIGTRGLLLENKQMIVPSTGKTVCKGDPAQWKLFKEACELYAKMGRSQPEKMSPFYSKNRYTAEDTQGHTLMDVRKKNIRVKRVISFLDK